MKTYKVKLEITAKSEEELHEKLQAFEDLQNNLEHDDLVQASVLLVEQPDLVDFIKEVMPKDKELGLTDYLSIAKKAYTRFG